jgi:hypothetical protein
MLNRGSLSRLLPLAVCAAGFLSSTLAAAQAVEAGSADGLLVDGGLVRLEHACAYLVKEGQGGADKDSTVVVVSDVELDEREVRSEEFLSDRARAGQLRGFLIVIDDSTGEVSRQIVFSAKPRNSHGDGVHWLAEEFDQNTARGGASFRSDDGTWGYAAQFNALIRRAPRFLEEGEAVGKLRLQKSTVDLHRAISWVETRDDVTLTHVVLSDRAVALEDAQDPARLAKLGQTGKAIGVTITVRDSDGAIDSQAWFGKGIDKDVATLLGAEWEAEEFNDTVIRGRLHSSGAQEALGVKWEYDAYFAAAIVGGEASEPADDDESGEGRR